MSEVENTGLTFEELTGGETTEEWNDTTTDNEYAKISGTAQRLLDQDKFEYVNSKTKSIIHTPPRILKIYLESSLTCLIFSIS